MQAVSSIRAFEGLVGPASRILGELLRIHPSDWRARMDLCLDVLVHATGADGGMFVDESGSVLARFGVADDLVAAFSAAWRSGMPRSLEAARLLHHAGSTLCTTIAVSAATGMTLVLTTHEFPVRRVDADALLALLPGVAFALASAPTLELIS